jgi:hypothetical protein
MEIIVQLVQCCTSCATPIALLIGGIWTYSLFVQHRQKYPRARIEHQVTLKRIANDKILFHAAVQIENIGDVLIELASGQLRLLQVLPLISKINDTIAQDKDPVEGENPEIDWYELCSRPIRLTKKTCEIEPGEKELFHCDFVISDKIHSVQLYSYFRNEQKRSRELGWNYQTLHDINLV